MAFTEVGRYTGQVVDEVGNKISGSVSETGDRAFGLLTLPAFQADAFQNDAFQVVVTAAAVEALAAAGIDGWYVTQIDQDTLEVEAFWGGTLNDSQTTLDVTAQFFPSAAGADETSWAQELIDWFPQIEPEDGWWGNTYGFPDQALDVVPQLFPPAAIEPIETFAAQPHFGDDLATYIPVETEDYGPPPEQNEWLAPPEVVIPELASAIELREQPWFPEVEFEDYDHSGEPNEWLADPEIVVPELIAVQPHYGELPIPAEETEDYANDSTLDVTPAFFPLPVEPIETFIAQPLAEQPWFPDQDTEDYHQLVEQGEPFAPLEVSTVELLAAQPHFGEWVWPEDQTEDYQSESSLDVSPQFFQVALEPDGTFAAQPHYGEWFWEDQETEDYHQPPQQNGWLTGTVPDAELAANAQLLDQPWFESPEIEDYKSDIVLDVTPQFNPPVVIEPDETFAAQPHFGEWLWLAEETEDYSNDSTLDVAPLFSDIPATIELLTAANYSAWFDWTEPETLEDYQHLSVLELTAFIAGPPAIPDGLPVEYALSTDTSAYGADRDSTQEAKSFGTTDASGSRDTVGDAKAVDTT